MTEERRILLWGGPMHSQHISGGAQPQTEDGFPTHLRVTEQLVILASAIPATIMEIEIGAYFRTPHHCTSDHPVYHWREPDDRWN